MYKLAMINAGEYYIVEEVDGTLQIRHTLKQRTYTNQLAIGRAWVPQTMRVWSIDGEEFSADDVFGGGHSSMPKALAMKPSILKKFDKNDPGPHKILDKARDLYAENQKKFFHAGSK